MTSGPAYQVLFLDAGAEMQCGVGQFTRRQRYATAYYALC